MQKLFAHFFQPTNQQAPQFKLQDIPQSVLQHHRIRIIQQSDEYWTKMLNEGGFYAENLGYHFYGLQCRYDVLIGQFYLSINVLNIHRSSESQGTYISDIGRGSFGIVKQFCVNGKKIAIKRLLFSHSKKQAINIPYLFNLDDKCEPSEIRQALKQYSIYKICSMLQIGPQVMMNNIYDLICYNDGIEFQMELCQPVDNNRPIRDSYQSDLTKCVRILHAIKFVHKDIKPSNTLFSEVLQKYVLGDFGITHSVKEEIGMKSQTYFQGSYHYASDDMKKLLDQGKPGLIDLYLNDYNALKMSFQEVRMTKNVAKMDQNYDSGSFSQNSMSMAKYEQQEEYSYVSKQFDQNSNNNSSSNNVSSDSSSFQVPSQTSIYQPSTDTSDKYDPSMVKFLLEINFYQSRVIFELLNQNKASVDFVNFSSDFEIFCKEKSRLVLEIKHAVSTICGIEQNEIINERVFERICHIMIKQKQYEYTLMLIRNIERVFGIISDQMLKALKNLSKNRNIPFLNYSAVDHGIQFLQKYQHSVSLRKLESLSQDLIRHQRLVNKKSLIFLTRKFTRSKFNSSAKDQFSFEATKGIIRGILTLFEEDSVFEEDLQNIRNLVRLLFPSFSQQMPEISCKNQSLTFKERKFLLVQMIRKSLALSDCFSIAFAIVLCRVYWKIGESSIIEKELYPIIQNTFIKFNSIIDKLKLTQKSEQQCTEAISFWGQCLLRMDRHHQIRKFMKQKGSFVLSLRPSLYKIKIIEMAIIAYILSKEPEAEQLTHRLFNELKVFHFPKFNTPEFVTYYKLRAQILYMEGRLTESYELLVTALTTLSNISNKSIANPIIEIYWSITIICKEMKNYEMGESFCMKGIDLLRSSNVEDNNQIRLLQFFLEVLVENRIYQNKLQNLPFLLQELIEEKAKVESSGFYKDIKNNIEVLKVKDFKCNGVERNTNIKIQKMIIFMIEPYLPHLSSAYFYSIRQMVSLYQYDMVDPFYAEYYIQKYFKRVKRQKQMNHGLYYLFFDYYCEMAYQNKSWKKLYTVLNKRIFTFPDKGRQQSNRMWNFLELSCLHLQKLQEYKFYNNIRINEAYVCGENKFFCEISILKMKNKFLRMILEKKLAMLTSQQNQVNFSLDMKKWMFDQESKEQPLQRQIRDPFTLEQFKNLIKNNKNGRAQSK